MEDKNTTIDLQLQIYLWHKARLELRMKSPFGPKTKQGL